MKTPYLGRVAAALSAIGSTLLFNVSVSACSLAPDYKGPETNFELVQQADTIIVGTLLRSVGKEPFDRKILVKPTHLLKGSTLPNEVTIRGFLSDENIKLPDKEIRVHAAKSAELDMWRPHPEVWMGGCSRNTFDRGMQVVLFFTKNGNQMDWFDPAFARSSEDVSGPDALWVRAVKTYVRIGRLPSVGQKSALRDEMRLLRKNSFMNRENTLLADDIERQLAGIGPVSDFDIDRGTSDEKRWIENIVNESYFGQIAMPEDVAPTEQHPRSQLFFWFIAGLLLVVGGVLASAFFRNKVGKPK
ncbi:MAG: hypothetical protein RL481_1985 [Pseudomonadota bacterium]